MNEEFEYGDIVEVKYQTDSDWEKGKFIALDEGLYPYVVRTDGALYAAGYRFCRKARPDLKIDDPVWVQESTGRWLPRHFAGWSDDGRIQAFGSGTTSHTNKIEGSGVSTWKFYYLENPMRIKINL